MDIKGIQLVYRDSTPTAIDHGSLVHVEFSYFPWRKAVLPRDCLMDAERLLHQLQALRMSCVAWVARYAFGAKGWASRAASMRFRVSTHSNVIWLDSCQCILLIPYKYIHTWTLFVDEQGNTYTFLLAVIDMCVCIYIYTRYIICIYMYKSFHLHECKYAILRTHSCQLFIYMCTCSVKH